MLGVLFHAGSILSFLLLGRLHARDRNRRVVERDTILNLLNAGLLLVVQVGFVSWVARASDWGMVDASFVRGGWLQCLFAFVVFDFTHYWVHRADHAVPLLWKFHRVHHSSESLDASSGIRMHVVDFLQLCAIRIVLFAVVFDVTAFASWAVPSALSLGVVFEAYQHGNIAMDLSRPWARAWNAVLNNPHFHAWHHARGAEECRGNYGNTLTVWDRWFGTDITRAELPAAMGLSASERLEPSLVGLQMLRPAGSTVDPR